MSDQELAGNNIPFTVLHKLPKYQYNLSLIKFTVQSPHEYYQLYVLKYKPFFSYPSSH
jgi:hypothetical protein